MLSTTALGVAPASWQSILTNTQFGEIAFVANDTVQISTFSEGGFINGTYLPVGQDTTSSASITDLLSQGTLVFSNITNGTSDGWAYFNSEGTIRLAPSVIIALDVNGNFSVLGQPFKTGFFDGDSGYEGGAIPIESILKTIGPGGEQKFAPTMLTKVTIDVQPAAESDPNSASAVGKLSAHEITGEWARAAVFEIAGGEPTRLSLDAKGSYGEQKSTSGKSEASREVQPVTSKDAERNAARLAARNAAAQRPEQPMPVDENKAAAIHQRPGATLPSTTVIHGSDDSTPGTSLDTDQSFGAGAPLKTSASKEEGRLEQIDAQVNEAVDAALEQLTAGDDVLASSSTDYRPFRSSIGIMPALLMLALERVAPRNWRRRRSDGADDTRPASRTVR